MTEPHAAPGTGRPLLAAVPTLDELVSTPSMATTLPRPVAAALLPGAVTVLGVLLARLLDHPERGPHSDHPVSPPVAGEPEYISADDVTRRFSLSRDWLEDHARDLRARGIVVKPSRKVRLYHLRKLRRFVDGRTTP
jgi:hypothetical protein